MKHSRGGLRVLMTWVVALGFLSVDTQAQVSPDSTALVAIYDFLGGDAWNDNTNWKSANPISTWFGVGVNGSNRVDGLWLHNNNVNGTLPPEFWTLTELKYMVLHNNNLNGSPIDPAIGNMPQLEEFRMWESGLAGSIPTEIEFLTSLTQFLADSNQLTGNIPSQFGSMTSLLDIGLSNNQLTGSIPSTINGTNLPGLANLILGNNQLNGAIPDQLASLSTVTEFDASSNQLTSLPTSFAGMTSLRILNLSQNSLSGSIPADLAGLTTLEKIFLGENTLTGSIPAGIGSLTSLTDLHLYDNDLNGAIPAGLWTLPNLQSLNLAGNDLSGQFPGSIAVMAQLGELNVQNNQMDGGLPSDLGSLPNLQYLLLDGNAFTGTIPASIGSLALLESFQAAWNQLSGSIPSGIGSIGTLKFLELQGNQLTGAIPNLGGTDLHKIDLSENTLSGSIPSDLGSLPNLTWISFYNNQLTGAIPAALGNLTGMTTLNFEDNQLSGPIPVEIYNLVNLQNLGLWKNQLTGGIDPAIGNLTQVQNLTLNENQLTGTIPATIGNLVNVQDFAIAQNQLTGPLPAGIGNMTAVQHIRIDNNDLSGSIPASIENLTNLRQVRASGNNFTGNLPDLANSPNLEVYDFGGNDLSGEIPASVWSFSSIYDMALWGNDLTGTLPATVQNIAGSIQYFSVSGNQMTGAVPPEIATWTNAQEIWLSWNDFSSLPDLTAITSTSVLAVEGNQLQFGDLEPNIGIPGFQYDPQDEAGTTGDIDVNAGEDVTLLSSVSGSANQYQWFKDGNPIGGEINSDLTLSSVSAADNGNYHSEVTNSIVGGTTITTATKTVSVSSDLAISLPDTVEAANEQILLPVTIEDPTGFDVVSIELKIAYDPAIAQPGTPDATDIAGTPVETWSIAENIIPGTGIDTLLVAASTADQTLASAGTLLRLIFDIQSVGVPNTSPVQLVGVLFNDGTPAAISTDGSIEIIVPVATNPGTNVQVSLVDQETGSTPVEMTFDNVTGGGESTMITLDEPSNAFPSGFQVTQDSIYFDLTTDAAFSDSVTVCYDYTGATVGDENALRLLHYEVDQWVDVTVSLNTTTNILCGRVDGFSEFGVGEATGTDGIVDTDPDQIQPGATITVTVTDVDEDQDTLAVEFITVLAYDVVNSDSQTVTLQETGVHTGVFNGTLATAYANGGTTNEDGTVGVVVGDTVYVAYTDSLNASSGTDVKTAFSDVIGGADGVLNATFVVQAFDSRGGVRDTVRVQVEDADGNADSGSAESLTATLTNSRSGETETLSLLETDLDTGLFRIRVPTIEAASPSEDGEVSVQPDDTLFVSYDDQVTATGNATTLNAEVQVINLFGDVQSNDQVQAFDAAYILASAVALTTPTGRDSLIMDVDGDADVLASDASDVLQYVVRLIDRFDVQTDTSFQSGVDDLQNHPFLKPALLDAVIALGTPVVDEGVYRIPIQLSDRKDMTSTTLQIGLMSNVEVLDVYPADPFGSYMVAHHVKDQGLRVALAGTSSRASGEGPVLWIEVRPGDDGPVDLSLDWVSINGRVVAHTGMLPESHENDAQDLAPVVFALHPNLPNPFNPQTTIRFDVPEASEVRIVVYSLLGQEVQTLLADRREVGQHQVVWNGQDMFGRSVATGVYFVRMEAGSFSQVRRMMLLK